MLARLAEENSEKVRIIKVDVSKDGKWAQEENVRGIPAFRLYSGGMLVDQFAGGYSEKQMQAKLDKYATVSKASARSAQKLDKDGNPVGAPPEPTVRPMPKNWLPSGVTGE